MLVVTYMVAEGVLRDRMVTHAEKAGAEVVPGTLATKRWSSTASASCGGEAAPLTNSTSTLAPQVVASEHAISSELREHEDRSTGARMR